MLEVTVAVLVKGDEDRHDFTHTQEPCSLSLLSTIAQ